MGLFGHVDHGKTELARALSEKVSTAGLDRHPEAKRRQMSIDIGFTAFTLVNYLVTLVDVPGHADLIRTAVSGASIIDSAILVVSATQGPQTQTGEHLVLLESLEIQSVLVALTKIDLVNEAKVTAVKESIQNILSDSRFRNAPIAPVSSLRSSGISELKDLLLSILTIPKRDPLGKFRMVIDHAFPIKGVGTVVTGTIVRGTIRVDEEVEISPANIRSRVKSIQTFKEPRKMAEAGDRVGMALQGVDHRAVHRGYYACLPASLKPTSHIIAKAKINRFFNREVKPGLAMHMTVGMSSVQAEVYPYRSEENKEMITSAQGGVEFQMYLRPRQPIIAEPGDKILLSLLSLSPTALRIAASGIVLERLPSQPQLCIFDEKTGIVARVLRAGSVLIGGLSKSKIGGERIKGEGITTERGVKGIVSSTFGTRGLVVAEFGEMPNLGEKVSLKRYRELILG